MFEKFSLIVFFALLFARDACTQVLPDLGDPFRDDFSIFQEKVVGASIMGQIRSSAEYVTDPEISSYINHLGYQLVANSDAPGTQFNFFVMIDETLNAFAFPGGYIGTHSGLILESENESMLAGVLGHEIAHVTQRHIARVIAAQRNARIGSLAAIATAILAARSGGDLSQAAVMTSAALPMQTQLNFTREHEREADRIGLRILDRAEFDVHQVPLFFKHLQRQSRLHESGLPEYLRTHPLTSERIADIEDRLSQRPLVDLEDSIEFMFVQARLKVYQDGAEAAQEFFSKQIRSQVKTSRLAGIYGLVFTAVVSDSLRSLSIEECQRMLDDALDLEPEHPMLLSLQADFERMFGDSAVANELYASALRRYPLRKSIVYGYAELLLSLNRFEDLEKIMSALVWGEGSHDSKFYEYRAKAFAGLNQKMAMHRDNAEVLALRGNLVGAINELIYAQKMTDGNFFLRTSVEARLRELRDIQRALLG